MTPAPSLHRALLEAANRHDSTLALSDRQGASTHADLTEQAMAAALALRHRGVAEGDPVVLALPNSREFVIAHFAILLAGGVSVPCEPGIPAPALAQIVARVGGRFVILTSQMASAHAGLCDGGKVEFLTDDFWAEANSFSGKPSFVSGRGDNDAAAILFTTGSTGRPKGVVVAHANTLFTIRNLISMLGYSSSDRELITLPISHSFGLGHVYCNLFSGGAVHLESGLVNLKRVFAALETFKPTGFPGTPLGFGLLIDRAGEMLSELGRGLRFIVVNSAALPGARMRQMQELLPNTDIWVYYGLTEASRTTLISLTKAGPTLYESVGRPMPGVDVRIHPDTQEILVRGPHVATYWNDPELTKETFRDGWLHTGDLGRCDPAGNLFLTGRIKDQINVGGYKVDPREVETVLGESGLVQDAAICGVNDLSGEEVVIGALVSRAEVDHAALAAFCAARLENYKIPVQWVSVPAIPRSETGKIKRPDLAELIRTQLGNHGSSHRGGT